MVARRRLVSSSPLCHRRSSNLSSQPSSPPPWATTLTPPRTLASSIQHACGTPRKHGSFVQSRVAQNALKSSGKLEDSRSSASSTLCLASPLPQALQTSAASGVARSAAWRQRPRKAVAAVGQSSPRSGIRPSPAPVSHKPLSSAYIASASRRRILSRSGAPGRSKSFPLGCTS